MNRNYIRSRAKELQVKHLLEKDYDLVVRTAGSKGIADVVALRFTDCGNPAHYEVKLIQIKVSENIKKGKINYEVFAGHNIEIWKFPVKSKKYYKKFKKKIKKRHQP